MSMSPIDLALSNLGLLIMFLPIISRRILLIVITVLIIPVDNTKV